MTDPNDDPYRLQLISDGPGTFTLVGALLALKVQANLHESTWIGLPRHRGSGSAGLRGLIRLLNPAGVRVAGSAAGQSRKLCTVHTVSDCHLCQHSTVHINQSRSDMGLCGVSRQPAAPT